MRGASKRSGGPCVRHPFAAVDLVLSGYSTNYAGGLRCGSRARLRQLEWRIRFAERDKVRVIEKRVSGPPSAPFERITHSERMGIPLDLMERTVRGPL